jgi:hypothetical protein
MMSGLMVIDEKKTRRFKEFSLSESGQMTGFGH